MLFTLNKLNYSLFAKAHECECGHINQNGKRCNGTPKLGEFTQVCITTVFDIVYFYLLI